MKDELQSKLVDILTSIQTAAGKASDFAMEQLPDIAQSYIAYGRAAETSVFCFGAIIFIIAALVASKGCALLKKKNESGFFALGAGTLTAMIGFAIAATNYSAMLMVWFAPKVWLLKEIATLIK